MTQPRAMVSDIELCAYLDGELPAERRVEIDAWLARQPEARTKLEAWRQQERMLRASFGRIAQEPLPRQMMAALQQQTEPVKSPSRLREAPQPVALALAPQTPGEPALRARPAPEPPRRLWRSVGLAVLGVSAVMGLVSYGAVHQSGVGGDPQVLVSASAAPFSRLTRHAAEAHATFAPRAEKWLDVRGADASALTAAAIQAGLDARLPGAVSGLQALGLRFTPGEAGLAALLLFDSAKDGRVSLFVTRGGRGGAPGIVLRESNGLMVAGFSVDANSYALTGAASRDQMVDWASALRATLVQPRSLRGS